ncbi:MAG TPA: ATP-binding protein [Candidatus Saccharimonadales bacterium]|nr:ATP-binding protein [Candidatus Saccharimonadales bacterium]
MPAKKTKSKPKTEPGSQIKRTQSIYTTFYVAAVVVMIAILVVGAIAGQIVNTKVEEHITGVYGQEQLTTAKETAASLQQVVDTTQQKLELLAQLPSLQSPNTTVCNHELASIIASANPEISNLGRINSQGIFYCSVNSKLIGVAGSSLGSYVTTIFNDPNHKPVMSRLIYPKGASAYVLAVHVPVYDATHQFLGTLGGAIDTDKVAANLLDKVRIGGTGFVSVVDDNGDIIYNTNHKFIGKNLYSTEFKQVLSDNPSLLRAFQKALHGQSAQVHYRVNGEQRFATLTSIQVMPGRRWVVYGIVPQAQIAASARSLGINQVLQVARGLFALILILAIIVLVLYLRRRVFKPLRQLSFVASEIQRGNRSARIYHIRPDEIGELGQSLNNLIDQLEHYPDLLEKEVAHKTTALKDALATSEAAKALDEAMISGVGQGLIVCDKEGRIERVNELALQMLGYEEKELIGQWFPKVIVAEDSKGEPMSNIDRPIAKALVSGKPISAKVTYCRKNGTKFPAFINVSPILLDKYPVGAIEVFRDITHEDAIERAKDEFLSLASHQLRTPATAVKQFLGLIVEGYTKDQKEADQFIREAYNSNNEQLDIIDDILNVAKIEAGKLELKLEQVDLRDLVTHAVEELTGQAKQSGHKLVLNQPKVPVPYVADKLKLTMSVQNFITNAIKYSPNKLPIITTLKVGPKHIEISVQDHGLGIAKADREKLFTKFGRIQNDSTIHIPGTGLGLYMVKEFVTMHHGKIRVESKLGRGTTFIIELPKEK